MSFQVFDVTLDLVRSLVPLIEKIGRRDPDLARQIRKARTSVGLNVGEGNRRHGRDRAHLFTVASGSADEVQKALLIAESAGYLKTEEIEDPLALTDRILAMLYRLTH